MELADEAIIHGAPLHPYTQALISAVPLPDPDIEETRQRIILKGDIPSPANPPKGCVFSSRCPKRSEICLQQAPDYRETRPGHFIACHHPGPTE